MDKTLLQQARACPVRYAWYKALGVSLLLHAAAALLFVAVHSEDGPVPTLPEPEQRTLDLSLVARNPQRQMAEEVGPETEERTVEEEPLQSQAQSQAAGLPTNEPAITPLALISGSEPEPADTLQTDQLNSSIEFQDGAAGEGGDTSAISWSSATVRTMVSAYARSSREQQTGDWLAACLIWQKEHGTSECPGKQAQDYSGRDIVQEAATRAFASITRPLQHQQLRNAFTAETKALMPLMEGSGPLADLARERYYLNREYVEYLSGNFDYRISNFIQASQSSHSYNGNGNAAYIRNTLQAVCAPQPCIWEFTRFTIDRPERQAEANENDFRVTASLFGNSR